MAEEDNINRDRNKFVQTNYSRPHFAVTAAFA